MQSTITSRQNSEINLKRRVTIYKLYSESKKIINIKLLFMFIIGLIYLSYDICLIFNINLLQISYLSFLAPFLSIIFTLTDNLLLKKIILKKKEIAAILQDKFDCDVLRIHRNPLKTRNIDEDIINKKYDSEIEYTQRNWYDYDWDKLKDESVAAIIAQKVNVLWEKGLNQRFILLLKVVFVLTILFIIFNIITSWNFDLSNILYGIFSLMYVLNLFLEIYNSNIQSQETNNKLNSYIDDIWKKILQKEECNLDIIICQIQDELFYYRLNTFLIPDWFYNYFKDNDEDISKLLVNNMIYEYNNIKSN